MWLYGNKGTFFLRDFVRETGCVWEVCGCEVVSLPVFVSENFDGGLDAGIYKPGKALAAQAGNSFSIQALNPTKL